MSDGDDTEVTIQFCDTKFKRPSTYRVHAFVKVHVVEATGLSCGGKRFGKQGFESRFIRLRMDIPHENDTAIWVQRCVCRLWSRRGG